MVPEVESPHWCEQAGEPIRPVQTAAESQVLEAALIPLPKVRVRDEQAHQVDTGE